MSAFIPPTTVRAAAPRRGPVSTCRPASFRAPAASSMSTSSASSASSAAPAVSYGRIQHAGVLVADTVASKKFYMDVLGMADDTALRNAKLPFSGAFLRAGSSQIHLMELPNPDPQSGRPDHGGRDRHLAVTVRDLEPLIESLEYHGRDYTFSKSGRRAVFTRDLDANAIEFIEDADA